MAPAKIQDDDPVTAEYDVYITPALQEQIYLLQYPNRDKNRPYNTRFGGVPDAVRLKPQTGHLEIDVSLNTSSNFNKYQSLKWGDAVNTAKNLQNSTVTYGMAAGLSTPRSRIGAGTAGRIPLKDRADRETQIINDLAEFGSAEVLNEKVLKKQTLGGQIIRGSDKGEQGKPTYFLGAFRGSELHLTKVDGMAQMRPQFHHIDADEQRARVQVNRAAAVAATEEVNAAPGRPPQAKGVSQTFATGSEVEVKKTPEQISRELLRAVEDEEWVRLDYVDEDEDTAYETFNSDMFVADVGNVPRLKSSLSDESYLDALSAPRLDPGTRKRKKPSKKKEVVDVDIPEEPATGS